MANYKDYLLEVISGEKKGLLVFVIKLFLYLLSFIYRSLVCIRKLFYKLGFFKVAELEPKVISVGNLTTGGTGKTPVVSKLAILLQNLDLKPAIISRGYQAETKDNNPVVISDGKEIKVEVEVAGDELYMLANRLAVPIIKGKNRRQAGQKAVEEFGVQAVILDDGLQQLQLKKDLEIIVIDAMLPFGYNHLLPRGLLREPLAALQRADLVLLNRSKFVSEERIKEIKKLVIFHSRKDLPIFKTFSRPDYLTKLNNRAEKLAIDRLSGKRVVALSGIGNPAAFRKTLEEVGAIVVDEMCYADHHFYTTADMLDIASKAQLAKADYIITTEKDGVKISPELQVELAKFDLNIYQLIIDLTILDEDQFSEKVKTILRGGKDEEIN